MKAAVVGVGYLGSFHAEKYFRSQNAELIAVVDTSSTKAENCGSKFEAKSLTDYKELPALGVQCASVAADTSAHFEIAAWLLSNGIDVLIEKPVATSIAQAQELIRLAEEHGRILQVGHLERFNPAFRAMEQLLTRPRFFEARRISPFVGRGHDVDVVLDLMIHDIDIISHLVGKPLIKVDAVGVPVLTANVDIANARLTFEGGAVANVTASRVSYKSERSMRIFQPDVYIVLDYGNKKLKMYTKSGSAGQGVLPQISIDERDVEERDALADQIEAFLECVKTRTEPVVSGHDGLRALELADRIRKAFAESAELYEGGFIPPQESHLAL